LEKLQEVDYEGGVRVEAMLSAELMNLRTGSIVWTGDAAQTSRVEGGDVNAIVTEMSRVLRASIDQLLTGMERQVAGPSCLGNSEVGVMKASSLRDGSPGKPAEEIRNTGAILRL
jgi:hypothetical protein